MAGTLQVGKITLNGWEITTNSAELGKTPTLKFGYNDEVQAELDAPGKQVAKSNWTIVGNFTDTGSHLMDMGNGLYIIDWTASENFADKRFYLVNAVTGNIVRPVDPDAPIVSADGSPVVVETTPPAISEVRFNEFVVDTYLNASETLRLIYDSAKNKLFGESGRNQNFAFVGPDVVPVQYKSTDETFVLASAPFEANSQTLAYSGATSITAPESGQIQMAVDMSRGAPLVGYYAAGSDTLEGVTFDPMNARVEVVFGNGSRRTMRKFEDMTYVIAKGSVSQVFVNGVDTSAVIDSAAASDGYNEWALTHDGSAYTLTGSPLDDKYTVPDGDYVFSGWSVGPSYGDRTTWGNDVENDPGLPLINNYTFANNKMSCGIQEENIGSANPEQFPVDYTMDTGFELMYTKAGNLGIKRVSLQLTNNNFIIMSKVTDQNIYENSAFNALRTPYTATRTYELLPQEDDSMHFWITAAHTNWNFKLMRKPEAPISMRLMKGVGTLTYDKYELQVKGTEQFSSFQVQVEKDDTGNTDATYSGLCFKLINGDNKVSEDETNNVVQIWDDDEEGYIAYWDNACQDDKKLQGTLAFAGRSEQAVTPNSDSWTTIVYVRSELNSNLHIVNPATLTEPEGYTNEIADTSNVAITGAEFLN